MFLFGLKMSLGIEDSPLFIFYLSLGKEEAVHDLWMHDVGIWNLKLRRKKKKILKLMNEHASLLHCPSLVVL